MATDPLFGPWLRQLRSERDLTQEALAEAVACATETVRSFENGRRRPSVALARRIAAVLQLAEDERERFLRVARSARPAADAAPAPAPAQPALPVSTTLLATRLSSPPQPAYALPRSHLLERLTVTPARLTLIVAPPGFGKSTLLSAWLRRMELGRANAEWSRGAWLALDEQDDDPARFLAYIVAAINQAAPNRMSQAAALLHGGQSPPQAVVVALINDLHAHPTPLTLVLDDYHLVNSAAVHDLVVTLVERAPAGLRLVIAARSDPPLPLARWRGRGLLNELRAADLRFDQHEAAALLIEQFGLPLSPAQVAALEERTEGWPAGLQLAGLSLRGRDDVDAFIAAFGGSHRFVLDYLASEALARLPAHLRSFLLQTAVLRRLSAPLCDALLGLATTPGDPDGYSGVLLAELERRNMFLVALDDRRRWWRYHQLFGEVLLAQLRAGVSERDLAELHGRAARWYGEAGEVEEALHHARLAGDDALAAALLERAAPDLLRQGALATLLHQLRALARPAVAARPALAAYGAWALVETGATDEAEQLALAARAQPGADSERVARGYLAGGWAEVTLVRQRYHDSMASAREALALLGDHDPFFRYELLITLAGACESANDLEGSLAASRAALALGRAMGLPTFAADMLISNVLSVQGRGAEAEAHVVAALEAYAGADGAVLPYAATLLVILGRLRLDRGLVAEARDLVAQARAVADQHGYVYSVLYACAMQVYVGRCSGDLDGATQAAGELRRLVQQLGASYWLRLSAGIDAELALSGGERARAEAWAEAALAELEAAPELLQREREYALSCIHVFAGVGRGAEALSLAQALGEQLRRAGRRRALVLLELYQVLCLLQAGRSAEALELLGEAVRQAALQGAPSLFLILPPQLTQILPQVRHVAPAFVEGLLQARGKPG